MALHVHSRAQKASCYLDAKTTFTKQDGTKIRGIVFQCFLVRGDAEDTHFGYPENTHRNAIQ